MKLTWQRMDFAFPIELAGVTVYESKLVFLSYDKFDYRERKDIGSSSGGQN